MSRWHGIADGTTVGGDVDAVTTADTGTVIITVGTATAIVSTAITPNRAADCRGVSGDSASGDWQRAPSILIRGSVKA